MVQLLIDKEYKAGKENEPYAVHTKLGWVLMGGKLSKLEKSDTNNVCLVRSIDEINFFGTRTVLKHRKLWNIV